MVASFPNAGQSAAFKHHVFMVAADLRFVKLKESAGEAMPRSPLSPATLLKRNLASRTKRVRERCERELAGSLAAVSPELQQVAAGDDAFELGALHDGHR